MISQGRINNALRALDEAYRVFAGREPGHNDRVVHQANAVTVLTADDRYLVSQSKVADDRLRVHHAKGLEKIAALGAQIKAMKRRMADAIAAEERADEKLAEAKAAETRAENWKLSCNGYVQQNTILRAQLEAANIEIDPRCR